MATLGSIDIGMTVGGKLRAYLFGCLTVAAIWFWYEWYLDHVLLHQMMNFLSAAARG